jgi:predicted nucleotidyltransferase
MIDLPEASLAEVRRILAVHLPAGYEVRVFGSRVRGGAHPYSDLDLVLVGKDRISETILIALKDAFSESDLPICVDVLDWQALSERFQKAIHSAGSELLDFPATKGIEPTESG